MKVRIHRGAREIGGNCIEVEAQGKRIVLDVGRPLDAEFGDDIPLPSVPGLADGNDSTLLGLFISHGHQDHWGLIDKVSKDVPVYIGEGAADILRAAAFFSPAGIDLSPAAHFNHRQPMTIDPFTITPYLNDHNGFDTYSLLIEADGRRLFYSADFQGHGPKWKIFQEMLRKPPEDVDVMLMEGTNVREDIRGHSERTEDELKGELEAEIRATKGLTLITYSSQSIDRLCTIYGATKRAGKTLVLDLLTAAMAQATKRESIPVPGWDHLLVYVPEHQRRLLAKTQEFDRLPDKKARIFREEMAGRRGELVLTFRASMARELEGSGCIEGATAIWSMWPGQLDLPSTKGYRDFLDKHGIPLKTHHASGHAYVKDLQKLAKAVAPKRLVPIHSFSPDRFKALFDNVEQHADGEWWEV